MKKNYTHIVALLDRSASMGAVISEMRKGFNSFLKQQRDLDGECTCTIVQFDDQYEKIYDFINLKSIPELTEKNYFPRGFTALVDSMVRLIDETGKKLSELKEEDRPEKVIFLTITDGEENSSKEFNSEDLKNRIANQENNYKWQFMYIGSNQDSFAVASKYGISRGSTLSYNSTGIGTKCMFSAVIDTVARYRTSDVKDDVLRFTNKQQKEVEESK